MIKYCDILKNNGLKNTNHRCAILKILDNCTQPLSARQLFLKLKANEINVDISTVYRNLDLLTEKNIVLKLNLLDENEVLYELNNMEHKHYLICQACNKIKSINFCPLGNYKKELESKNDFTIIDHEINIYGYCSKCKKAH